MDLIELLKAILFGVVEGITEWLPVSSTGHMLLLEEFLKLDVSPEFWDMFLVVIQLGAILAVCVLFFRPLNPFSPSKGPEGRRATWLLWAKIVVACVPAAVVGIAFDDLMSAYLGSPFIIAAALIVYGVAFIVIENRREARARELAAPAAPRRAAHLAAPGPSASAAELADAEARVTDLDELPWGTALGIGAFQVLSLVPGTSRSGSTIIGGMLVGTSRTVATEFSFFMSIPIMFGASLLKLVKFGFGFTAYEACILLFGMVVAFFVSILAIKFLVSYVSKNDFKIFGYYRIVLGVIVLAYFFLS